MSVKARLANLRRGLPETVPVATGLATRIDRLRVSRQTDRRKSGSDEGKLCQALQGAEIADGVLLVERRIAAGTAHGNGRVGRSLLRPKDLPDTAGVDPENMLFLDTETTGLSGGSGSLAFMVGLARLEEDDFIVRQYLLTRFAGEQAMLQAVAAWVRADDLLVTFNGKTFDLPLLSTRYRMAGVTDPLLSLPHLDLLYPVRRAFSRKWDDCRLARVERQLLEFQRRNDLPGAEAPAAWFDWIRQGDGGRLPQVCRHNQWDLLSLALLLPKLVDVYRNPGRHGADPLGIARAYRKVGQDACALMRLLDQKTELGDEGLAELAGLLHRSGQQPGARAIWQALSARGNQTAREQLAKHFEHEIKDYRRALAYAAALYDDGGKQRRCSRLRRKLARLDRQSLIEFG